MYTTCRFDSYWRYIVVDVYFCDLSGSANRLCLGQLTSPVQSAQDSNPKCTLTCFQEVIEPLRLVGRQPDCVGCVRSRISYNSFNSYWRYIVVYVCFCDLFW